MHFEQQSSVWRSHNLEIISINANAGYVGHLEELVNKKVNI